MWSLSHSILIGTPSLHFTHTPLNFSELFKTGLYIYDYKYNKVKPSNIRHK